MITPRDNKFFDLALKAAQLSECGFKHGAVISSGNRIIALAHNLRKSHPFNNRYSGKATIHAEMRALILAKRDVTGMTLYSARSGGNRVSKPCAICALLIQQAGIRTVVYFDGNELQKERI